MDGQMNIFDYPEYLPEESFDKMTIERAAELVGTQIGMKFNRDERFSKNIYSAKSKGFTVTLSFCINYEGKRILATQVDYKNGSYGNPALSIDDSVKSIKSYMDRCLLDKTNCIGCEFFGQGYYKVDERTGATWHYDCPGTVSENYPKGTPVNITLMLQDQESLDCFVKPKPICKFSNHSCNKEELWNVAVSLDNNFCPHVCCRMCSDKSCGARCNGAEVGQKIDQDKAEYAFKCFNEHCQHRGWCRGDEDTGKATWMCSFVGRQQAKGWSDWRPCTIDICPLLKEEK